MFTSSKSSSNNWIWGSRMNGQWGEIKQIKVVFRHKSKYRGSKIVHDITIDSSSNVSEGIAKLFAHLYPINRKRFTIEINENEGQWILEVRDFGKIPRDLPRGLMTWEGYTLGFSDPESLKEAIRECLSSFFHKTKSPDYYFEDVSIVKPSDEIPFAEISH